MTLQAEIKTGKMRRLHDEKCTIAYRETMWSTFVSNTHKLLKFHVSRIKVSRINFIKEAWGKEARIISKAQAERMTLSKLCFLFSHPELSGLPVWEGL